MMPKKLSRTDFNNILNYYDIRANEFVLVVNNETIESEYFTSHLTSNTDVVTDYVSVRKVKRLVQDAESFVIKVKKHYPFHETFIDDALEISCRHLYAYTPVLVAACNSSFSVKSLPGLPAYFRVFEGDGDWQLSDNLEPISDRKLNCKGKSLLLILQPNEKLQRELTLRMFRKKIHSHKQRINTIFSLSDREQFYEAVKQGVETSQLSESDAELFRHTLLQTWPCSARGRLSSYILLKENTSDLEADLISWNTRVKDGKVYSLGGKMLCPVEEVQRIVEQGTNRYYGFKRNPDVDKLAIEGIIQYRRMDHWKYRGWVEYVSSLDPTIVVRSDGKFRWLKFPYEGFESLERLADGVNIAVGASFIEKNGLDFFKGKKVIAAGLGLAVIQRKYNDISDITSVEMSPAVVDIFTKLYPDIAPKMKILVNDFFIYLSDTTEKYDTILFDMYDPKHRLFTREDMENALRSLLPNGLMIINKNGSLQEVKERLTILKRELHFDFVIHELGLSQYVVIIKI